MIGLLASLKVQDQNTGEYKTLGEITDLMIDKALDQVFDAAMFNLKLTGSLTIWRNR